jgi:hypothetical protein
VKLFGPVQLNVALPGAAVKLNVCPAQRVGLPDIVGVAGVAFTTTFTVPAGPAHPLIVCATE